ncbi:MAG TPA: flagellar basal body rod protein FlgB [Clostridia bacterium]|nr:flagellar basal body rod protein FlgB [Clostridia bacterium]
MSGLFSDTALLALEKALDTYSLRQQVISHNIANVNTPGYKRSYVSFEDELKQALGKSGRISLRRADARHLGQPGRLEEVGPQVKRDLSTTMRADGNNVDIDVENAELAMNAILYNAAATRLNQKLAAIRYVINGGR